MCNHYRADRSWIDRTGEFSHLKIPIRFSATPGNYQPPEHIYPGRDGMVLRLAEDGAALEPSIMRWGLIPWFHKKSVKEWKASCNNCRSEEMATKATFKSALAKRRCLVPAAAFYESQGRRARRGSWGPSARGRNSTQGDVGRVVGLDLHDGLRSVVQPREDDRPELGAGRRLRLSRGRRDRWRGRWMARARWHRQPEPEQQ